MISNSSVVAVVVSFKKDRKLVAFRRQPTFGRTADLRVDGVEEDGADDGEDHEHERRAPIAHGPREDPSEVPVLSLRRL